jgi:Flp pilus assembly protein TadG
MLPRARRRDRRPTVRALATTGTREERARRASGDRGAVIVESALVVPILLILVFGMIDFGINLSDQIAVREGVREGVRQSVVDAPGATTVNDIVALTKSRIGITNGARVYVVPEATATAAVGQPGSNLSVCAYVPMRSLTGFYKPLLNGRYMWSRVTMRVEQEIDYTSAGGDAAPSGSTWARCSASG